MDIREISRQIGTNEEAAAAAIGGTMKLVRFKMAEHLQKRLQFNNGMRMLVDSEFVEENFEVAIAEMDVHIKERERMRNKITELLQRINELEGK